jgi:magnesium-transporting ATPase (P-type)
VQDPMLFTDRSLWTMAHGVVLGGAALMALAAALFALGVMRVPDRSDRTTDNQSRALTGLMVFIAIVLWVTVFVGTYIIFPPYRATPPAGLVVLSQYPRALLMANAETAWLHAFGMESKEHMPWIASMLATAVAFVSVRYRWTLLRDAHLRRMAMILLAVSLALVSFVGLMGVFIDKVAPLH